MIVSVGRLMVKYLIDLVGGGEPGEGGAFMLEDGSGRWLMEDGSSVWLLE